MNETKPCALCGESKPLRDSHYFPKAAYKELGKSKKSKISPVKLDMLKARANSSDKQYKKHLLCNDCEKLFSKREDIVSRFWRKSSGFLLKNQLRNMKIYEDYNDQRVFPTYPPVSIKQDDLFYFILSIVWRASQGPWGDLPGINGIPTSVMPHIEKYLLGSGPQPAGIKIIIYVDWKDRLKDMIRFVSEGPHYPGGYWFAQFVMLGLTVDVFFGCNPLQELDIAMRFGGERMILILDIERSNQFYTSIATVKGEPTYIEKL
ncbi:hypothetical protein AB9V60_24450 [Pseudomonas syringae pv. atrofaciens]|uniref:hypothetical protein n=2 Tax=Pseudomonas syringae TaxID=317 RepID=UPI00351E610E